ncbi:MAG: glycosyltransferase [bacterium]
MIDISVIIVNWNVKALVLRLIQSIKNQTKSASYEIILVDNASSDGSVAAIIAEHPEITIIANNQNLGFAKAVNQGLQAANGRILLVQNPDSEFISDSLSNYVREFDSRPELGIVGARLLNADRTIQESVRRFPTPFSQLLVGLKLQKLFRHSKAISKYLADDFDYSREAEVDQVMGASFAFRRDLMEKIGLLDERFFIWFEEVDFMKRAKDAGYSIRFMPQIEMIHHGGQSFGQIMTVKKQRYFSTSMAQYMQKHFGLLVGFMFWALRPISLFLAWLQTHYQKDIEKSKTHIRIFEFLAVLEAGSWIGHAYPSLALPILLAITAGVFVASLQSLALGLSAIALEVIIGSHGHMIGLGVHGESGVSLRITMFLAVMLAWMIQILRRRVVFSRVPARFTLLILAIVYALVVGFLYNRPVNELISDANGYAFLALLLPLLSIKTENLTKIKEILGFGTAWLAIKTLVLVYVFSHFGDDVIRATYIWVRDTRVAEVTRLLGNFHRVFLPSHLFLGLAMVWMILTSRKETRPRSWYLMLGLFGSALVASLSRSILLGLVIGLCFGLTVWAFKDRSWRVIFMPIWRFVASLVIGVMILAAVVKFPIPSVSGGSNLSKLLVDRYSSINDPAVGARWELLKPLWAAVKEHPILGSGFAKSISYLSPDPFWRNIRADGLVVTTRFEWGWLDVWLKFGLIGGALFLGYLAFLWRALSRIPDYSKKIAAFGVFVVLLATHATTPYLDHPIGLSVLLLLEVLVIVGAKDTCCNRE